MVATKPKPDLKYAPTVQLAYKRPCKPNPSITNKSHSVLVSLVMLSDALLEITLAVGLVLGTSETLMKALTEVLPTAVILDRISIGSSLARPGGAVVVSSSLVSLQITPESQILASFPVMARLAISFHQRGFLSP
jgi:hypothetical protein